MMNKEFRR